MKLGPVLRTHEPGQRRLLLFRDSPFRVSVGVVPQSAGAASSGERAGGASRRLRRRAALRAAFVVGRRRGVDEHSMN